MPPIKLQHVVSFTSEDPKHKAENLVNENGMWLCKSSDLTGTIKAEFQLRKARSINYIDIGNSNSATLCVEVGMSSWPISQSFVTLLPTVVLMTPGDCRSGQNAKCVKMFKKENLDEKTASKKWDRVRVTCSQPFMRNIQYGLAFFKLYALEEVSQENKEIWSHDIKKEFINSSLPSNSPSSIQMSESLVSLENGKLNNSSRSSPSNNSPAINKISSPISRAGRLVMAHKHMPNEVDGKMEKKELECEALSFLISMNLTSEDIHSLKVSHIREEFEIRRKKSLNIREKSIFKNIALDYAAEKLKNIEREIKGNAVSPVLLLSDDEEKLETKPLKNSDKFSFKRISNDSVKSQKIKKKDPLTSPHIDRKSRNDLSLADANVAQSTPLSKEKKRVRNDDSEGNCNKSRKTVSGSPVYISDDDRVFHSVTASAERDIARLQENNYEEPSSKLDLVECPICTDLFTPKAIEEHASNCDGETYPSVSHISQIKTDAAEERNGECPICGNNFPQSELQQHAEECAERTFS